MKFKFNNIKTKFNKYLSTNKLFCSFVIISLIMVSFLRSVTIGNVFSFKPLLTDFAFILFFGSLGYFFKPNKQFKYFFGLIIFTTLLCLVNSLYYQFYNSYVSISLINAISQIQGVNKAITTKLSILNFIYIIGPIIYYFINKNLKKKNYYDIVKDENSRLLLRNTIIVGFSLILIIMITMSHLEWDRLRNQINREYLVSKLGVYAYTLSDLIINIEPKVNTLFTYDNAKIEVKAFYEKNSCKLENNLYTGIFEDKNVILVHMESIQDFLINLSINDTVITPNLNKLINESMYFENFYPQISIGTSSDTEFTLNTSLMPSTSGTAFISYSDRTLITLPNLFKEKGYYTFSMHGNDKTYWNRHIMHKKLGYDRFYSKEDYDLDNKYLTLMGINDEDFFMQSIDYIKEIDSKYDNYYGTLITLSNHTPWFDEDIYDDIKLTKTYSYKKKNGEVVTKEAEWLENSEMGRYLVSSHYADYALGKFIDRLESEGLLDDTILILYGDHQAKLSVSEFNLLYNYDPKTNDIKDEDDEGYIKYDKYTNYLNNKTPFIIYSKNSGIDFKGVNSDVMGMYDVMPTIANLFNTNVSKYALGNDIFSNKEKIVIFPTGNFITNKVYYNSTIDKFIALNDEEIESDYIEQYKEYTSKRLEISNLVLVHDLIKNEISSNSLLESERR